MNNALVNSESVKRIIFTKGMNMKKILISLLAVAVVSIAASAYAGEILINGSFEDGMTGWTTSGNVYSHPEYTIPNTIQIIRPTNGSRMAVLGANQSLDASLSQGFALNGRGPVTISFDFNLAALDFTPAVDAGSDRLSIWIGDYNLATIPINDLWDGKGVRQGWSVLGWQTFSQTFTDIPAGQLSIRFDFANRPGTGGDGGQNAIAFLDNVSVDVTNVPEPSFLLLLSSGLLGVGLLTRKRA